MWPEHEAVTLTLITTTNAMIFTAPDPMKVLMTTVTSYGVKVNSVNLMGMYAHCLLMLEALRCFAMMDVTNLSRECTDNTNVNSG